MSRTRSQTEPGTRVALFAEMLATGLMVFIACIPLLTAVPALAAGTAHLKRHIHGRPESVRLMIADLRAATIRLWPLSLGALALGLVLLLNLRLASSGVLAAGGAVGAASVLVGAGAGVVVVRTATIWSDGEGRARRGISALDLVRRGARHAADDLSGSLWLVAATAACAVFTWMLLPLSLVVGGLVSLAAVAVEKRRG